jgi:hypothetical protein
VGRSDLAKTSSRHPPMGRLTDQRFDRPHTVGREHDRARDWLTFSQGSLL